MAEMLLQKKKVRYFHDHNWLPPTNKQIDLAGKILGSYYFEKTMKFVK